VDQTLREHGCDAAREPAAQEGVLPESGTPLGELEAARILGGRLVRPVSDLQGANRLLTPGGAEDGERKEHHEGDAYDAVLVRRLAVVIVRVVPDAPLDGRRLVGAEGMEPRAEAGAEQRVVADDRAALDADGEAAREADVGELARRYTVSGEPQGDRGGARGSEHESRRCPAHCTPRLAPSPHTASESSRRGPAAAETRRRSPPTAAAGGRNHQSSASR